MNGAATHRRPAGDTRTVTIDVADLGSLALGEVAELADLTGVPLDELSIRLRGDPESGRGPRPQDIIRVALALAVVLERRTDPGVDLADARRWDIQLVADDEADPTPPARVRGRRPHAS